MSDKVNIGYEAKSVDIADPMTPITKVILVTSEDGAIEVGDSTGRTLEMSLPFGNREKAEAILDQLKTYQYQPFRASSAITDPSVELGDYVEIADVNSGIFRQDITFGTLETSDISSPFTEEIDSEYQYETSKDRQFERKLADVGSTITQTAEEIRAEVYTKSETNELIQSSVSQSAEEIRSDVYTKSETDALVQSSVSQTANEIRAEVYTKADTNSLISSTVSQTAENLKINFTNEITKINSYIRVENGVVIIGLDGNEIELRESNSKVAFVDKGTGVELAYIANNRFYMPNATVTNTMRFGGYEADATSNGIVWKWVGR